MSVASPQNREEFKKYILTRLGDPVLQVNVADEQLDICINDAFQYFNERNHFNGVENVFLTYQIDNDFKQYFKSFCSTQVQEKSWIVQWMALMITLVLLQSEKQNAFTLPDDVWV